MATPASPPSCHEHCRRRGASDDGCTFEPLDSQSLAGALRLQASLPSLVPAHLLRRNLVLLNLFSFLLGLAFLAPVWVLYLRSSLADRATRASLVLAAQALSCCVLELPAGIIADLCGRKHVLMASAVLRLVGLVILATIEAYMSALAPMARLAAFLLASVCEGFAVALASGSDVALLHDSLTALGRIDEFQQRLAHRTIMWPLAAGFASLAGAALADGIGIRACMAATALAALLSLGTAAQLAEVYERIYAPARVWRKRKQRGRGTEHEGKEIVDASSGSAEASPSSSLRHRHDGSTPLLQPLPVPAAVGWPLSPPSTVSSPGLRVATAGEDETGAPCSSQSCPLPCPSPLSTLPPHSLTDFTSLLRTHLSQCVVSLRGSSTLRWLILVSAGQYGFSEPLHRVRGVFLATHGLHQSQLGIFGAATYSLSAMGSWMSGGIRARAARAGVGDAGVILLSSLLSPLLQWLACFAPDGWPSALLLFPSALVWGVRLPLLAHLLHRHLPHSSQRATVASVQSLANKLALSLCLTFLTGPLTDAFGIDVSVCTLSLLSLIPVPPLMRYANRRPQEADKKKHT